MSFLVGHYFNALNDDFIRAPAEKKRFLPTKVSMSLIALITLAVTITVSYYSLYSESVAQPVSADISVQNLQQTDDDDILNILGEVELELFDIGDITNGLIDIVNEAASSIPGNV